MSDIHQSPLDDDNAAPSPTGGSSTWDEPAAPSGSQSYNYGTPAASASSDPDFGASAPDYGRTPETPVTPTTPAAEGGMFSNRRNCLIFGIGGGILALCLLCMAFSALGAILGGDDNSASDEPGIGAFESDGSSEDDSDIGDILQGEDGSEDPVQETDTSVMQLRVGDCFNNPEMNAEGFVEELPIVDCSDAHDREVFASLQFPEGDGSFPGDDGFDDFSEEGCVAAFEPYVGIPYDDSAFFISTLEPTEDSWGNGDREILCILYEPDIKNEGSAQGSER